ncbi:MAG: hypothetical protein KC413_03945, partial [Anaerolineales bacterium]|nr:hypothetical protein [Anaerolineales bacterium]
HLAADSAPIKLGDFVTPDTIVGTVSATQNHIHVEFHIDVPGTYHDKLQNPTHFMPETMKMTLIQISIDPATENYAGTHFYKRTDDLWVTQGGQPTIIEYGLNLNVGQGNYSVPDSWD